jgi:hypothetical protein
MQFKIGFAAAHREFCLMNQTAQQSGFPSATMVIEQGRGETMKGTVRAISQLATATPYDRGTIATLTPANAKLDLLILWIGNWECSKCCSVNLVTA